MKVKVTAKFFLDNGEVKKIDWIEVDPKLKGVVVEDGKSKEVEIVLKNAEDVQKEYGKLFRRFHKEGDVFVVKNVMGEYSGIPFQKVTYWTVKAEEVQEGKDGKETGESADNATVE